MALISIIHFNYCKICFQEHIGTITQFEHLNKLVFGYDINIYSLLACIKFTKSLAMNTIEEVDSNYSMQIDAEWQDAGSLYVHNFIPLLANKV